ncbi:hypothetical protein ACFE04_031326 [Oxalis oulophora]
MAAKVLLTKPPLHRLLQSALVSNLRLLSTDTAQPPRRRRSRPKPSSTFTKSNEKSDWWIVDGEMHEIGDHVPPRERFIIPRDNIPNRRRKQLREQFMRRTRLVLKDSVSPYTFFFFILVPKEHEPWCKKYMELYNEMRENWERLYWDEGYSKRIARDHANYDSAEDDDQDFSPYRSRKFVADQPKDGFRRNEGGDTMVKVNQIRDKFEYDRERRMRDKAFAPMNAGPQVDVHNNNSNSQNQPIDTRRYFSGSESD